MVLAMTVPTVVGVCAVLALGVAAGWQAASVHHGRRRAAERAEAAQRSGQAAEQHAALQRDLALARAEADRLRAGADDRRAMWEEARQQMAGQFAELSQQALARSAEHFLQLADGRLAGARQAAAADLDARRQAIADLLDPLREQLGRYEAGLAQLERDRRTAYGSLHEQVRQLAASQQDLQAATRNLVTALRAPATRGRWGELQLRRVVEMAGMVDHCDFDEQVRTGGAPVDGRPGPVQRPDLVVHLPGDRQVVVDAKVPLQAFLTAAECDDEGERRGHLLAHARQLRAHVDALAKKAYWQQFDRTPDLVVAFVPGDALLAAALEHDAGLFDHAVAHQVLLATPTTLIALLRSVAYGWQHQDLAANARQVQQLGRELHRRLAAFGDHLARLGRSLGSAVGAYNDAVGSLERSVLPQARRFPDLGVVGAAERAVPPLDPVDAVPRPLAAPELAAPEPAEAVGPVGSAETAGTEVAGP